jgi:hypothetical protein
MPHRAIAPAITTGLAVVGAGMIAATPVTAPVPGVPVPGIALAGAEEITLDLVRHGACCGPIVSGEIPGHSLTETGQDQAQAVADQLELTGPFAGIYAGEQARMPETAAPLAEALGLNVQTLPGLSELDAGIYEGAPLAGPGGILYELTVAAWALGLELEQMPGSHDFNGVVFDDSFSDAVHTIYDDTVSGGGPMTDAAFSGQAAISAWTLMHVDNPDVLFFVPRLFDQLAGKDFLPDTGVVEVKGDPDDGWTLVSWDGHDITQDPGLVTDLIVDVRNLLVPMQAAAWHLWDAVLHGDDLDQVFQDGLDDVGKAVSEFPQALLGDIASDTQTFFDDLFGGSGDGGAAQVSTADIQDAFEASDAVSFGGNPVVTEGAFAGALAHHLDFGGGDISADDVTDALSQAGISTETHDGEFAIDGFNFGPDDVAEALNNHLDVGGDDLLTTLVADLF